MNKQCGLVNNEYIPAPRIQDALSTLLASYGFKAMSEDVLTEGDAATLRKYASVVAKQAAKHEGGERILNNLRILKLI